jgi:hypothetical protein
MVSANLVADRVLSRPSAVRSASGPTRLRLADLLHITDRTADEVLSGHYDHVVPLGGVPTDDRWFARLLGHGGSLGALTLLSGSLDEFRWDGERLRRRRLEAGDQAGFPLGWVHDVVWAPTPAVASVPSPAGPTLSVHAYSPPLAVMSYYEVTEQHTLRRQRTELTDQPENL